MHICTWSCLNHEESYRKPNTTYRHGPLAPTKRASIPQLDHVCVIPRSKAKPLNGYHRYHMYSYRRVRRPICVIKSDTSMATNTIFSIFDGKLQLK